MDTTDSKARRFEAGLNTNLRDGVAVIRLPTYEERLQRAEIIADGEQRRRLVHILGKKPLICCNNFKRKYA